MALFFSENKTCLGDAGGDPQRSQEEMLGIFINISVLVTEDEINELTDI